MSPSLDNKSGEENSHKKRNGLSNEFEQFFQRNFALVIITGLIGISGFALVIFLFYAAANKLLQDATVGLIFSLGLFFLGSLLSYVLTAFGSQITRRDELRDLGKTSASHLALLRSKIRTLSEKLLENPINQSSSVEVIGERLDFIEFTLRMFAYDAGASTTDIASMARLDQSDVERILNEAEIRSRAAAAETAIERILVGCPHCGREADEYLSSQPNSTRHIRCLRCEGIFSIHRLPDGTIRTGTTGTNRSWQRRQYHYPVSENVGDETAHLRIQLPSGKVQCPNCGWKIQVNVKEREAGRDVVRNCFECYERIYLDPKTISVKSHEHNIPIEVDEALFKSGRGICPSCKQDVASQSIKNRRGDTIQSCPNCGALHKLVSQQTVKLNPRIDLQPPVSGHVVKQCPTPGCGAEVSFKLHDPEPFSMKFCYECVSRLRYNIATDSVELIERPTPRQVDRLSFLKAGKHCPYCNALSNGGFKMNSKGQRLSVCMDCKGLFEFV